MNCSEVERATSLNFQKSNCRVCLFIKTKVDCQSGCRRYFSVLELKHYKLLQSLALALLAPFVVFSSNPKS